MAKGEKRQKNRGSKTRRSKVTQNNQLTKRIKALLRKQQTKKKKSSSSNAKELSAIFEQLNLSSNSDMQVSSNRSSLFSEENRFIQYLPEDANVIILAVGLPTNANLTFLSDETTQIVKVMNDLPTNNVDCVARSMILNSQYMLDPVLRNTFIQGAKMYIGVINVEREYINNFRKMIAPGDYYRKRLFDAMDPTSVYGFLGYRNIRKKSEVITAFRKIHRKIPDYLPEYITTLAYRIDSDKPTAYGHAVNFAVTKDNSNTYYYHLLDLQLYQEQFKQNQNHILRASSIEELVELATERWWNGKIPDTLEVIAYAPAPWQ